ncbi:MAG: BTAD domain-containing putative transcriptional regulator, partial [Chloroflexota bacterium]
EHLRQLLQLVPYDEAAHRQMMYLYARNGQTKLALKQYEQCQQVLTTEFDLPPESETIALYEQIKQGEIGPDETISLPTANKIVVDQVTFPHSPYQGLTAFTEADADMFFGREAITEVVVEAIQQYPIVALVGPSGSGKSSLVQAGVVPKLRHQHYLDQSTDNLETTSAWLIVSLRPGSQPLQSLAAALFPWVGLEASIDDPLAAIQKLALDLQSKAVSLPQLVNGILKQNPPHRHFLLIIDQFEELYTLTIETERLIFLDLMLEISALQRLTNGRNFHLLATLRADFMGQALAYRPLADGLAQATVLLGPMSRTELQCAIVEPAAQQKVHFEAGLVERILDEVGEAPAQLPLLEFALTRLWQEQAQVGGLLSHVSYDRIGRGHNALAQYAEQIYAQLGQANQVQMRRILLQLVQPGDGTRDTRRLALKTDLGPSGWEMVHYLADQRLVVTGTDAAGNDIAEVIHEALIHSWDRLQQWLNEDRSFRLWQEQLRLRHRQWQEAREDEGGLLQGSILIEAQEWLNRRGQDLSDTEVTFIEAGSSLKQKQEKMLEAQRQQELDQMQALAEAEHRRADSEAQARRRLRWFAVGITLMFLAAALAALVAIQQRQIVATSEALSRSLNLASNAQLALREGDTDLALALALEANKINDPPEQARLILGEAAYAPGTMRLFDTHSGSVNAVAWSPDERWLLSGADDHQIILWDVQTGDIVYQFSEHASPVLDVVFHPNGETAFSADADGNIIHWVANSGKVVRRFSGHEGTASVLAIDPKGDQLLSGGADQAVILWDVQQGEIIQRYVGHTAEITAVTFSPDAQRFLSGGADNLVFLWDTASTTPQSQLDGHVQSISSLTFLAKGKQAITTANDAYIWDIEQEKRLTTIQISGAIFSAALSPDEKTLLISTDGGLMQLWALADSQLTQQLLGHRGDVVSLSFSEDGRRVLSGASDGDVRIWDLWNGAEVARYAYNHVKGLMTLDLTEDAQTAVVGSSDGVVIVQPLTKGSTARQFQPSQDWLWGGLHILPDQQTAIIASGSPFSPPIGQTLHRVNITNGAHTAKQSYNVGISRLDLSPNGKQAIFSTLGDGVYVWDMEPGSAPIPMKGVDTNGATGVAFHPDGQTALLGFLNGEIHHIDLETGQALGKLIGHEARVRPIAISPDGKRVLSGAFDQTIRHWDLETYTELQTLVGHQEFTSQIRFLPDGSLALSASVDKTLVLWNVEAGTILRRYTNFRGSPLDIRLSEDGRTVYSVEDRDAAVLRVWRLDITDEDLQVWVAENRYVRTFSCEERVQYNMVPLC